MYNRIKAFSLIELMITIAIIGILAAIAVPSYQHYVLKAKTANYMVAAEVGKIPISEYVATSGDLTCEFMLGVQPDPPANSEIDHMFYGPWPDGCVTYASTANYNGTGNLFALGWHTTDGETWECVYTYTGTLSDVSDIVPNACRFQS